jgi:hypothetical protein
MAEKRLPGKEAAILIFSADAKSLSFHCFFPQH